MVALHIGNWGQTLLEDLRESGFSDLAIIGNSGINIQKLQGDEPSISFDQLALLFERAAEITGNDLIGFEHGRKSDYRRGGLLSYTGAASPSIRTLLHNISRFQRVTGDVLQVDATSLDTTGELAWRYHVPPDVVRRQYVEFSSAALLNIIRNLTNRRVTPIRLEYRHYRKSNLDALERYYGCEIVFGARVNRIKFKLLDLDLPLDTADDHLYKLLEKFSDASSVARTGKAPSLVTQVEDCIAETPNLSQADVAKIIGMSSRTLSRRLKDAQTSFQTIQDNYRFAMAKNMLIDSDFQLTEIAYVLGYADPSTFSTAFRRRMSQTPSEYRRNHKRSL